MLARSSSPSTASTACRLALQPNAASRVALRGMLDAYQGFLAWLDEAVPKSHPSDLVALHRSFYEEARARTGLPSQVITLGFRDWTGRRRGEVLAGMPLDHRLYSVKGVAQVSIATLSGRISVPYRVAGYEDGWSGGAPARLIEMQSGFELWAETARTSDGPRPQEVSMTTDNVLSRIGRLIAGMTHAALDQAEGVQPVAVLEQAIREIDAAADEVRVELGKAVAERHRLQARRDELAGELRNLDEQLQVAVRQGRDDLAEVGIGRQLDIEAQTKVLDTLLGEVDQRIAQANDTLEAVRASRREAESRLRDLKQSQRVTTTGSGEITVDPLSRATAKVERAEIVAARINGVPNQPQAANPAALDALNALSREHAVKERLARLKAGNPS
jgi:phage shock protein A